MAARPPEKLGEFAEQWLSRRKVTDPQRVRAVMEDGQLDRIAHDAGWLRLHAQEGVRIIDQLPAKMRAALRKLWAHGFHAGARHESITANLRFLPDVRAELDNSIAATIARPVEQQVGLDYLEGLRPWCLGRRWNGNHQPR